MNHLPLEEELNDYVAGHGGQVGSRRSLADIYASAEIDELSGGISVEEAKQDLTEILGLLDSAKDTTIDLVHEAAKHAEKGSRYDFVSEAVQDVNDAHRNQVAIVKLLGATNLDSGSDNPAGLVAMQELFGDEWAPSKVFEIDYAVKGAKITYQAWAKSYQTSYRDPAELFADSEIKSVGIYVNLPQSSSSFGIDFITDGSENIPGQIVHTSSPDRGIGYVQTIGAPLDEDIEERLKVVHNQEMTPTQFSAHVIDFLQEYLG